MRFRVTEKTVFNDDDGAIWRKCYILSKSLMVRLNKLERLGQETGVEFTKRYDKFTNILKAGVPYYNEVSLKASSLHA
jgi:hypothetical protein